MAFVHVVALAVLAGGASRSPTVGQVGRGGLLRLSIRAGEAEEAGKSLRDFSLTQSLIPFAQVGMTFPRGRGSDTAPVFDVGVPPELHAQLCETVAVRTYREIPNMRRDFKGTVERIAALVDSVLRSAGTTPPKRLREWLLAEGICAYATSKVKYAFEQVAPGFDVARRFSLQEPNVFMESESPVAVCDGIHRLCKRLASLASLKAYHIDGHTRFGYTGKANQGETNHGWVVFEFDGGIRVPADATNTWPHRLSYASATRKVGWRILPRSIRAWQAILAFYYQTRVVASEPSAPANLSLVKASLDEWARYDAAGEGKLVRWYDDLDSYAIGDYKE